ncbi:MAG: universal stress protein [bacterium]|nr:universal stress protein [bacterium]
MTTLRRILVAIDASPASLAAAEAAAELSKQLSAELEGVFVREHELLALAGSPLARHLDLFTASIREFEARDLDRDLTRQAARAGAALGEIAKRAGVEHRFRVAQGTVATEIARASDEVDLVILGAMGWSSRSRARTGSTVRELLLRRDKHTLVLERWVGIQAPIRVACNGTAIGARALEVAISIAKAAGQTVEAVLTEPDSDELRRQVLEALEGAEVAGSITELSGRAGRTGHDLVAGEHGLLLLPQDLSELDVEQVLEEASTPILLVS